VYGHIYYNIARPAPTLLQAFHDVSTATLSDAMGRLGFWRHDRMNLPKSSKRTLISGR
jgi:hypothetical protein